MLNYCNFVLLIACLCNNIMQNIVQMGTVDLYVFFFFFCLFFMSSSSDDVLHVCNIFSCVYPSVSHIELIGAVLHTSVSRAVRFLNIFFLCRVFHDISQMIMTIKTVMANRV